MTQTEYVLSQLKERNASSFLLSLGFPFACTNTPQNSVRRAIGTLRSQGYSITQTSGGEWTLGGNNRF